MEGILYLGLGVLISVGSIGIYAYLTRTKKQPKAIEVSLEELPQNIEKKRVKVGQALMDIKQDTTTIIKGIEETKELIRQNTQEILTEIKKLSQGKEVVYSEVFAENEAGKNEKVEPEIVDNTPQKPDIPKKENIEVKKEEKKDLFNSMDYLAFYTEKVLPIVKKMPEEEKVNADILLDLMKIFDEAGEEPSVVNDIEGDSFRSEKIQGQMSSYDILRKVNLRQHTLNVAKKMYEIIENELKLQNSPSALRYLIVAFAHDLGKLKKYRPENYTMHSHPVISAKVLSELLEKSTYDDKAREEMIKAVEEHHTAPTTNLGKRLKEADQKARELEKREVVKDWDKLPKKEFREVNGVLEPAKDLVVIILERIFEYINRKKSLKNNNQKKYLVFAFEFNGWIYIDPILIHEILKTSTDIALPDYFYSDDSNDVSKAKIVIANTFRKLGYLDDRIKEGYFSAKFKVQTKTGSKIGRFLPISVDALKEIGKTKNDLPQGYPPDFEVLSVRLAESQSGI